MPRTVSLAVPSDVSPGPSRLLLEQLGPAPGANMPILSWTPSLRRSPAQKNQFIFVEIIANSLSSRNNCRPFHGEVLKNPGWHVDVGEGIQSVGDQTEVGSSDSLSNLLHCTHGI